MGQALLTSSGIHPEEERCPHIIKDFMTSLKKNIKNKITNRWAEMRNPPRTIQDAFKLADDVELQLQVAESFKLEPSNNFPLMEVNEMSAAETAGDEFEVNEMSRGKKWGNNNNSNYITNTQVTIQTITSIAGSNTTNLKKTGQVRLEDKKERLQGHFDTGVSPLHSHGIQQQLLQTIQPSY